LFVSGPRKPATAQSFIEKLINENEFLFPFHRTANRTRADKQTAANNMYMPLRYWLDFYNFSSATSYT
jgi:hypothetical protein